MKSNADLEFLTELYKGAKMGVESINDLLSKAVDTEFRQTLQTQLAEYEHLASEAETLLAKKGGAAPADNPLTKAQVWTGVQFNTMLDSTSAHMAEIMIQGSTMGITKALRDKTDYHNVSPEVRTLANKFIATEQSNIEHLKAYL